MDENVDDELVRPAPPRSVPERARSWVGWFGLDRLIASAVAVSIVCGGAFWLVRSPRPPAEASLPQTQATFISPTLPQPSTVAAADDVDVGGQSSVSASSGMVTVHVAGAVAAPGVYVLAAGDRVDDAVAAAGGALSESDVDALNLAAPVADGSRIYVPQIGEAPPPVLPPSLSSSGDAPVADTSGPTGLVDVNRATATELETLPGVGPATSTAIVAERERNGPFLDVDDLERVPGIGPAKLAAMRDLVTA